MRGTELLRLDVNTLTLSYCGIVRANVSSRFIAAVADTEQRLRVTPTGEDWLDMRDTCARIQSKSVTNYLRHRFTLRSHSRTKLR